MTAQTSNKNAKPLMWYEQDPGVVADASRFHIKRQEQHLQMLQDKLTQLIGDGWVRKPNEIKAPTERDEIKSAIVDCERRLFKSQDFADAFTRISLRGGKSSEINNELLAMKEEGILRRHPVDMEAEQILQQEYNVQPDDTWFAEYNPKYTG